MTNTDTAGTASTAGTADTADTASTGATEDGRRLRFALLNGLNMTNLGRRDRNIYGSIASLQALEDLNPHLTVSRTPPGERYSLRVPVGSAERVADALDGMGTAATE